MLHQNNTASILKNLTRTAREVQVYPDGFGFKDGLNLRLSNIPNNIRHDVSILFKMAIFLFPQLTEAAVFYFAENNKTHYKVDSKDYVSLQDGVCGSQSVDHAVAYGYDMIKEWQNPDSIFDIKRKSDDFGARFYRGAGEPTGTIESCITQLINEQIDAREKLVWQTPNPITIALGALAICFLIGLCNMIYKSLKGNVCTGDDSKQYLKHTFSNFKPGYSTKSDSHSMDSIEKKSVVREECTIEIPVAENKHVACQSNLTSEVGGSKNKENEQTLEMKFKHYYFSSSGMDESTIEMSFNGELPSNLFDEFKKSRIETKSEEDKNDIDYHTFFRLFAHSNSEEQLSQQSPRVNECSFTG